MTRKELFEISKAKPAKPFMVDESLTYYSPQENVDALKNPEVIAFQQEMLTTYDPRLPKGAEVTLLILPCAKHKPYPISAEHLCVNKMLLQEGYQPVGEGDYPKELVDALPEGYEEAVLNNSLLKKENHYIHRMVVSEPMGIVPYEYVYYYAGKQSVSARYDDPGLFEHRGMAASPWRSDCTATLVNGKYKWGVNEKKAYALVHNQLSDIICRELIRIEDQYSQIVAYVAPKLTHRSFLTSVQEKKESGLRQTVIAGKERLKLIGVNDMQEGLVQLVPTMEELEKIREKTGKSVAVPLGLSESLAILKEIVG